MSHDAEAPAGAAIPAPPAAAVDDVAVSASENEILWTVRRFFILMRYWTTPLNLPVAASPDDQASARTFALFLIVALTYVVRVDEKVESYAGFTAIAGGIALIMSVALSTLSEQFHVRIRERMVISAYASTIFVMIFFVLVETYLPGTYLFEAISSGYLGYLKTTIFFAAAISYLVLVAKAVIVDRHRLTILGLVHGASLVAGSSLIVLCISTLSTPLFNWAIGMLNRAAP
jgi:hypothetical protein